MTQVKGFKAFRGYGSASGNNRNNGANLGPFCVNANNGWSDANGNNWSGRVSSLSEKWEKKNRDSSRDRKAQESDARQSFVQCPARGNQERSEG